MFSFLKNHPFAVEAFFDSSIVLTFSVPKEEIESLIPECLELDTFNQKWAFIAVALVQTKRLRPKGFPALAGNDFFLIGYRAFVRFKNNRGKRLRGLYILKSETNKKSMELLGNIFTQYKYKTTDITAIKRNGIVQVNSKKSGFNITFDEGTGQTLALPAESPFNGWKDARRFAGPLPFTFSYDAERKNVLIIEGVRKSWQPEPLNVINYRFSFLDQLNLQGMKFANAFIIKNIPYYWKKGRIEKWNP